MITVGCTGHQTFSVASRPGIVARMVEVLLALIPPEGPAHVTGVCSLAVGADQMFAHILLALGGGLHAVVPSARSDRSFSGDAGYRLFATLLQQAVARTDLPFDQPTEEAYMAAGQAVVDRSDLLIAVWDSRPARGLGGTADVVAYAHRQGRPVEVIWPAGSRR